MIGTAIAAGTVAAGIGAEIISGRRGDKKETITVGNVSTGGQQSAVSETHSSATWSAGGAQTSQSSSTTQYGASTQESTQSSEQRTSSSISQTTVGKYRPATHLTASLTYVVR